MTDLETLRAMFDRADVGYRVDTATGEEFSTHPTTRQVLETAGAIGYGIPAAERGAGNLGYLGFFTGFGFDADGKLLWVGAWE